MELLIGIAVLWAVVTWMRRGSKDTGLVEPWETRLVWLDPEETVVAEVTVCTRCGQIKE